MNSRQTFSMVEFIKSNSKNIFNDNMHNPKLGIELIIQKVLECNRIDLYTKTNLIPNREQLRIISNFIQDLESGVPIQYILNQAPFYGRNFFVNKNVLIPRFDTELIIEIFKKYKLCDNLLEIGTGSGNIAITIAKEKLAKNILATDISEEKISIARYNKKKICPKSKIRFIIDDFMNSRITEKFDVIISNPPYIPINEINKLDVLVKNNEPIDALTDGNDGYDFYRKFASYGNGILKNDGFMLLEIGINNQLKKLHNIFCDYKLEVFNDLNNIPRVIKIS